jgi:UDP-N-acetylglucosamine enolpyruvyl transferase
MPKRFPPRAPAISPKALTMLAAVLVCRHNSQLKNVPITIADIKATMPELEKLVGES